MTSSTLATQSTASFSLIGYRVRSVSPGRAGTVYTVRETPAGLRCECKAAQYGRDCYHVQFVAEGIVKPAVRLNWAAQTRPVTPAPKPLSADDLYY